MIDQFTPPAHGAAPALFDYKDPRGRVACAGGIVETILVCRFGHPGLLAELIDDDPGPPSVPLAPTVGRDMVQRLAARAALEGARRLQREVRSGHQQAALAVSAAHLKLLLAVVVGRPY